MAVFRLVKFQVCLKEVNISFEPEFGNPRKLEHFQFSVNLFLSNCWFQSSAEKPGVLKLFLSCSFFFYSQQQKQVLKPNLTLKTRKIHFQPWKMPFQVYFKRASTLKYYTFGLWVQFCLLGMDTFDGHYV